MLSRCLIYRSVEVEFFLPSRKACSGIHETQTAFKTSTQTQQTPKPEKGGKIPFVLHVTLKDATTSWGDVRKGRGFFFCNIEEEKKLLMSLWFLFSSPSLPVWVFRSPRQMLLSHLLRAQKLWTSPGGGGYFVSNLMISLPHVIFASPRWRLQVTRRLEAVRGPCITGKL